MAISYPRELPDVFLDPPRFRFDFTPLGTMSRTQGGAVNVQERAGGSLWEMSITTRGLNDTDWNTAHAFYLSLLGGGTFRARDLRRRWPQFYPGGFGDLQRASSGGFDGTCSVTAAGGRFLTIAGLPNDFRLMPGDYVSFDWRGSRALVKSLEDVRAGPDGIINGVEVRPWLVAGGDVPAEATMAKAWCLMKPKPGSWSGERTILDGVGFEAIQTLG